MGELIYNGRHCQHCGSPIARPATYSLHGFHHAVVCDHCWEVAALSYLSGMSQADIARRLGVNPRTVRSHLIGYGLLPGSEQVFRENLRRNSAKHREQNRERDRAHVRAYYRTERGREQHRERLRKYRQKRKAAQQQQ